MAVGVEVNLPFEPEFVVGLARPDEDTLVCRMFNGLPGGGIIEARATRSGEQWVFTVAPGACERLKNTEYGTCWIAGMAFAGRLAMHFSMERAAYLAKNVLAEAIGDDGDDGDDQIVHWPPGVPLGPPGDL